MSTFREMRKSSDLVLIVPVDPLLTHTHTHNLLRFSHTGLLSGLRKHQVRSCRMAFALVVLPSPETHQAHSCFMAFSLAILSGIST